MIDKICGELFFKKNKCRHEKISPDNPIRYCPDCGKEIAIIWYIIRCSCCSGKRDSIIRFDKPVPIEKFCSKCGSNNYYIEKIEDLKFYDLSFAVLFKEEINQSDKKSTTQIWIENDKNWQNIKTPKLIAPLSA